MKLNELKIKPELQEIKLNSEAIIKNYGDEIVFYMMSHLDIQTYFDFFKAQSNEDLNQLIKIIKSILLDKDGKRILADDEELPMDIYSEIVGVIGNFLGKSTTKNSTSVETGEQ